MWGGAPRCDFSLAPGSASDWPTAGTDSRCEEESRTRESGMATQRVCICLKKVDSQKESIIMTPHTEFQKKYYQQVIEIHQKTGFSPRKIAKLQLVPVSVRQMYHWIAIFEAENGKGSPRRIMEAKKSKEQEELESLKSRISELEESLRVERLRNRLNEKIIDIAEARWHIEIRKKAGTKR